MTKEKTIEFLREQMKHNEESAEEMAAFPVLAEWHRGRACGLKAALDAIGLMEEKDDRP